MVVELMQRVAAFQGSSRLEPPDVTDGSDVSVVSPRAGAWHPKGVLRVLPRYTRCPIHGPAKLIHLRHRQDRTKIGFRLAESPACGPASRLTESRSLLSRESMAES